MVESSTSSAAATASSVTDSASSAMSSITSALSGNSKNIIIVLVIVAALAGILYYMITNDMIPGLNKFFSNSQGVTPAPDGIGATDDKVMQLYLFKVDWCPHCKTAKPVFDEVEKELNGRPINGYTVVFKTVDCEGEPDMADKFKIEGFPTIKLVKDGQVIEYDAKPDKEKIKEFLETVTAA
jgi:thiol-disulfide isomerase/thioredoxin